MTEQNSYTTTPDLRIYGIEPTTLFLSGFCLIGLTLCIFLIKEIRKQRQPRYRKANRRTQRPSKAGASRTAPRVPASVLPLFNGDTATAHRLYLSIKQRNPRQSDRWVWDKVAYDVTRDRD